MTMGDIQLNLDMMMMIIDDTEHLTDEQIDDFINIKKNRGDKVDGWISYRDRTRHFIAELKDRSDRFKKALKSAKNLGKRIDERYKYYIETDKTGLAFKGTELGTVYLQKSPKSLAHIVPVEDKAVSGVITDDYYKEVCSEYLKEVTYTVLDKVKLKADLEAGVELSWATIEQRTHVRVKG